MLHQHLVVLVEALWNLKQAWLSVLHSASVLASRKSAAPFAVSIAYMVLHACGGDLLGTCMQPQACNAEYDFALLYMYHNLVFVNDPNVYITTSMGLNTGAPVSIRSRVWVP